MSHPFGDLLSHHLHRRHGLSQAKLAAGVLQDPAVVSEMCRGRRLTGSRSRRRVTAIIAWLQHEAALTTRAEADALLAAAGMAPLSASDPDDLRLLQGLAIQVSSLPAKPATGGASANGASNNLPIDPTPFVGRARELSEVLARLADPDCRLLTLLGPGGVGKSRLSVEAARRLPAYMVPDGVYLVPGLPADSADGLVAAIAAAIEFRCYPEVPAREQLLDYLREKQMLLILDNVDALTTTSAMLVSGMLSCAPKVKLLATSRELVNVREEWLYPVDGLSLQTCDAEGTTESDALKLFAHCAKRVYAGFGGPRDIECANRICRLVEGMPLAIELATSWLKMLACEDIAQELEHDLGLLSTRMHNMPEPHRSIHTVFEQSWHRLTPDEQTVVMRLAVHHGFCLEAARATGGASIHILAALVDKSLVHRPVDGRYEMHALLRQFALEKLAFDKELQAETLAEHSTYYLSYLIELTDDLLGEDQAQVLPELGAEDANIRAAWQHAVQHAATPDIAAALSALYWCYALRSRFEEGEAVFALAAGARQVQLSDNALHGRLCARQGAFAVAACRYTEGEQLLDEAAKIAQQTKDVTEQAFVLIQQGLLAHYQGRYALALERLKNGHALSELAGDAIGMAQSLFGIATVYGCGMGQWDKVSGYQQRCLQICEKYKLLHQAAYALEDLGTCFLISGKPAEAAPYYRESSEIFRASQDWYGYAKALNGLGAAITFADPSQRSRGQRYKVESIEVLRKLGHRRQLAHHLGGLSDDQLVLGELSNAYASASESCSVATAVGEPFLVCFSNILLAKISCARKEYSIADYYVRQALVANQHAEYAAWLSWCLIVWVQTRLCTNAATPAERIALLALMYRSLIDQTDFRLFRDGNTLVAELEAGLTMESIAAARTQSAEIELSAVASDILQLAQGIDSGRSQA
jgi:predicted ATPase